MFFNLYIMTLPIITTAVSIQDFVTILENNPGLVIAKFGAEWCGPCKKIAAFVEQIMNQMPNTVQSLIIDVDDSFELYGYLKSKKMVSSIPTVVCDEKGNTSYIPNKVVVGSNVGELNFYFGQWYKTAVELSKK
jgi:thioredoxin 1